MARLNSRLGILERELVNSKIKKKLKNSGQRDKKDRKQERVVRDLGLEK